MVRPAFRRLLDTIFATVSPDGASLRCGPVDALEPVARRALDELAHCVLSAMRSGVAGPRRDVGERFAALMCAVLEDAGGAALTPEGRDALAGLALIGLLSAIDGPEGYSRYIRRFGTLSRFVHYDMLSDAEATAADRLATVAAVRDGSLSGLLVRSPSSDSHAGFPLPSAQPVDGRPGADPGGPGWRHAPPLGIDGRSVASVWHDGGERLYHGPRTMAALGYGNASVTLTQLALADPSLVRVIPYRDPESTSPVQRRRVRFLTPYGLLTVLMRVRPTMASFGYARGMLLAFVGRLTSSSPIDLEGLDRRHAASAASLLRLQAVSRERISRLETLVRDYVYEVGAVRAEVEDARTGEVSRRRGFDLRLASLEDEVARLRARNEVLEDEKRLLQAEVASVWKIYERAARERQDLDTSDSIGRKRRRSGPGN